MCQQIQTDKMIAYEQAVKAYQFQVTRYNTWMNYYALFVGALFVSFYMIICYSKSIDTNIIDPKHLLTFIAALGIIASICWMASLIGNCAWMNNYIKAVKKNETIFFGEKTGGNESLVVYRRLIKNSSPTTEDGGANSSTCTWWKTCIDWIKKKLKTCLGFIIGNRRTGFISTQKMTQWFVGAVLAAWIYIFVWVCAKDNITITQLIQKYIIQDYKITISIIAALVIWVVFKCIPLFLWSDNLKGMKPKE